MENYKNKPKQEEVHGPMTSDDYLLMARMAPSRKMAIDCVKRALKLDKNNLDAGAMLIETTADTPFEALGRYQELLKHGEEILKEGKYFEEHKGDFYEIPETRPYMRVRREYIRLFRRETSY